MKNQAIFIFAEHRDHYFRSALNLPDGGAPPSWPWQQPPTCRRTLECVKCRSI